MNYWVVQEIRGEIYMHGPYRSSDARDNRSDNLQGGEINQFNSFESDPVRAKQEYLNERVKEL